MDGSITPKRPQPETQRMRAQPFVSDGVFGWLHAAPQTVAADAAVLICGALSREALDSHHSLRVMADSFARAGYPTMRFDYAGQGDSPDIAAPPGEPVEHWAIWQRNVQDAADRLRRLTGARRLIFCGLRIGATLAARVAQSRNDVAGLILLAPVLRGRPFLRQMQVEGALAQSKAAKADGLDCHELSLSPKTVALIGQVDLRHLAMRSGLEVAIFSQASTPALSECLAAWSAQGAVTASFGFAGLEPLLCPDTQGYKEPARSADLTGWLHAAFPPQPRPAEALPAIAECALQLPGCVETPLRFGPGLGLFGILCQPDAGPGDMAVMIVNTGRNPHAGVGRFGVEFARRLAACGITTLRFDFAGFGDSLGLPGEADMRSDVFEDERSPDISAAIDAMSQLGCRRFIVHGICSGAYHALHAAVAECRIEALLMINLPTFLWVRGDSIAEAKKRSYSLSHYRTRLLERAYWARLLRGDSDVLGTLKGQLARLARLAPWPGRGAANNAQQSQAGYARKLMAVLSRRRVKSLFLFDPDHSGAYEIQSLFGKDGAGLNAFEGADIRMVPGLGEAVAAAASRKCAGEIMIDFINQIRTA